MEKKDIRELSLEDLVRFFVSIGESKFRAKQVYEWLWKKSAYSFDDMSNLSKKLRERLKEAFVILPIIEDLSQVSGDGTIKFRFKLHDGHLVESVLIPVSNQNRYTVCISSQVGCSLACKFCATGQMDRLRNLTAAEIYDQVVKVNVLCQAHYDHPITNVVYMGMGEPLLAYKPVMRSVELLTSEEGLNMAPRRITVSTAGIAKMIKKLADDGTRINLALSLHAADDEKRNSIMAINESNDLKTLTEALRYFYDKTKDNKITFEYIAFDGFNDSIEDAKNLLKLCRQVPTAKVNVIEYNPVSGVDFIKSGEDKMERFAQFLRKNGVGITLRRSRGKDIDAACGQLANKE
ncbi:MAG: Ribosomal RNA large subunit methyltransferase N (EC [uncultured Aureispira sp.]|uniref:Probable dual-specificity RNA methyltransferase RlmN n=1 Tax=uncultured Aureispira sp. TaxID=1331704 RepID=A0A6S6SEG6_9BACT|nr:MAG: Ribosomal RNA large subunit methyltransferase N (EC [uncultured Aureispira sp.]